MCISAGVGTKYKMVVMITIQSTYQIDVIKYKFRFAINRLRVTVNYVDHYCLAPHVSLVPAFYPMNLYSVCKSTLRIRNGGIIWGTGKQRVIETASASMQETNVSLHAT